MFIDKVLMSVAVEKYGKAVEGADGTAKLEAVCKVNGDGNAFAAQSIQVKILEID